MTPGDAPGGRPSRPDADDPLAPARDGSPAGRRSLLAVLGLSVVPWTVVGYGAGDVDLLFLWGLVNSNPWQVTDVVAYLTVYTAGFESLPPRLRAWPVSSGLYLLAVASATVTAASDRGDPRLTAGLVALSALVHLRVTAGLSRVGERPLPVGVVLALVVAAWVALAHRSRAGRATDSG